MINMSKMCNKSHSLSSECMNGLLLCTTLLSDPHFTKKKHSHNNAEPKQTKTARYAPYIVIALIVIRETMISVTSIWNTSCRPVASGFYRMTSFVHIFAEIRNDIVDTVDTKPRWITLRRWHHKHVTIYNMTHSWYRRVENNVDCHNNQFAHCAATSDKILHFQMIGFQWFMQLIALNWPFKRKF